MSFKIKKCVNNCIFNCLRNNHKVSHLHLLICKYLMNKGELYQNYKPAHEQAIVCSSFDKEIVRNNLSYESLIGIQDKTGILSYVFNYFVINIEKGKLNFEFIFIKNFLQHIMKYYRTKMADII